MKEKKTISVSEDRKKGYVSPALEVQTFGTDDIVRTSSVNDERGSQWNDVWNDTWGE